MNSRWREATALNVLIAVLIGSISGFLGGKVDSATGKRKRGLLARLLSPFN